MLFKSVLTGHNSSKGGKRSWKRVFRLLASAILIGVSVAAPVGVMGILTIRRTLAQGHLYGIATGLGIAAADGVYATLAAFGISTISQLLIDANSIIRLIGGIFLVYLGIKTIRAAARDLDAPARASARGLIGAAVSAFALTMTNPLTILVFTGIFAGIATANAFASGIDTCPAALAGGMFTGSLLWWLVLTTGVSLARRRLSPRVLRAINVASGIVIAGFGVVVLVGL